MNYKKKVLFFLPSGVGGAEKMTITIAKLLPKDMFDIKFVIVSQTVGMISKLIPKDFVILHIHIRNIYDGTTFKMIRIIKQEKPDVVFCSLLYLNARLIIAAKVSRVKVIVRNNIDLHNAKKINKRLVRLTYRWADKIIAQQNEMKKEILESVPISEDKIIVLQNPIDKVSIIENIKEHSTIIRDNKHINYACVARFDISKGQDLLVRAFKILHDTHPNDHLYLIGKYNWANDYDNRIKLFVEENSLSDYVHFVGFDPNPYKWMNDCDCYVMPSRKEGLPNSLIEAMSLGKPVVATSCIPVISRIVRDGYNGYIVPPDDYEELAASMIKAPLLSNFSFDYVSANTEDFVSLFYKI